MRNLVVFSFLFLLPLQLFLTVESAEAGVLLKGSKVRVNIRTPRATIRNVAESTAAMRRTAPRMEVPDNEFDEAIDKINRQYAKYERKLYQFETKQARLKKRAAAKAERERKRELEKRKRAYEVYARKQKSKTPAITASEEKKPTGLASILPERKSSKVEIAKPGEGSLATPKKKLTFWQHVWRALVGT